ncbi:Urb2/Npa2 family-domain-containing protein [Bipolaris maydis]|nr:Urb2/Npa2 family-domain-containing protein [Bipolaris maydis]
MAPIQPASKNDPASTRPRLQAINQDFSDLDEQISQVAHIIGLPEDWTTVTEEEVKARIIQRLVRARAEWVLRWILDKLKDDLEIGRTARGNANAWQLLEWMIQILPVSRSASHLRDASFPSILERALVENFDKEPTVQPAGASDDVHMNDDSESSATIREDSKPSKKRKRGTVQSPPLKMTTLDPAKLSHLFHIIRSVVASITRLAAGNKGDDITQAELMKMVLRTDSAQASRILRFWLTSIYKILSTLSKNAHLDHYWTEFVDLSLPYGIWDLRTVDAKDETGASAEEFSTECLVPTLDLLVYLQGLRDGGVLNIPSYAVSRAIAALDKSLTRHLFAPSRAAFFGETSSGSTSSEAPKPRDAQVLASNLEPLRAKLLQAAQIEDGGDVLPKRLASLFDAVPYLLDLVIRISPSRTPKSRAMEKPWLQAVFSTLAECAGCSLTTPPEFITRQTAVTALSAALRVLQVHEVTLGPDLVKTIFWYHCGVKYPEGREKEVHWSLIASLIELDSSVFVIGSKSGSKGTQEDHTELVEFIFEQISAVELSGQGFIDEKQSQKNETRPEIIKNTQLTRKAMLEMVIIPLMSAFVRSRNLLGFIRRWDDQLIKSYRHGKRKALKDRQDIIWQDRALYTALAGVFEQSLTQSQITILLQEHEMRLVKLKEAMEAASKEDVKVKKLAAYKNAASSAVLIPAFLQSIRSDNIVEALKDKGRSMDSSSRAAAMLFCFNACDRLQTVPGSEDAIRNVMQKILENLSPTQLGDEDDKRMVEVLCTYFVNLLEPLEANACRDAIYSILSRLPQLGKVSSDLICKSLSESIAESGSASTQSAYSAALLQALGQDADDDIYTAVAEGILHINPLALAREQRKSILDRTTELLTSGKSNPVELLSVITHLQQVPNASAQVSTEATVLFDIAEQLHQQHVETETVLQLLRELVQKTLVQILPNQTQSKNKEFVIEFTGRLLSITKATDQCSLARLSILQATSSAQKQNTLLHIERYVDLLKKLLSSPDIDVLQGSLDAFNELSISALREAKLFDRIQTWLRTWIKDAVDLDEYQAPDAVIRSDVVEYVARVYNLVTKFELYPDMTWLVRLTLTLVQWSPVSVQNTVHTTLKEAVAPLAVYEKLDLIAVLTADQKLPNSASAYRILNDIVSTIDDRLESNAELKQKQLALLPKLCALLAECPDYESFNSLLSCVDTILNDRPSLVSQYSIECTFGVLVKLTSRSSPALPSRHAPSIFSRLCHTSRLILLVHRGRLGGRFHLFLPLLQGLLFCLFIPNASRSGALPSWLRTTVATEPVRLTAANASQFTRLLSTLCNPPQSSITKAHQHHQSRKSKDLNDPIKAAREKASNFLYPLLASFCRFQLNGRLDHNMREKLMPGIWEVVGTASLHRETLDAMFAGLGRSERDVWKGLWEDWEGVYGRRQVVGHGD